MIDFACKRFNIKEIIKCSLGLTKVDYQILEFFINDFDKKFTTGDLANKCSINLTTSQKTVKKLYEKNIIKRSQKNLENGGYTYVYTAYSKAHIRSVIKDIINSWSKKVESGIDQW